MNIEELKKFEKNIFWLITLLVQNYIFLQLWIYQINIRQRNVLLVTICIFSTFDYDIPNIY